MLVGRSCFKLRNSESQTSASQRHFLKCIDKDIDSRIKFATEMLIRSMQYMIGPSQCGLPTRGRWMMERVLNGIARHETPRHRPRGFAPRLSQEETGLEGFGCSAEAFIFFAHGGGGNRISHLAEIAPVHKRVLRNVRAEVRGGIHHKDTPPITAPPASRDRLCWRRGFRMGLARVRLCPARPGG